MTELSDATEAEAATSGPATSPAVAEGAADTQAAGASRSAAVAAYLIRRPGDQPAGTDQRGETPCASASSSGSSGHALRLLDLARQAESRPLRPRRRPSRAAGAVSEIKLSPLQTRALELLAERDPVSVVAGTEVHAAVGAALVDKGLAWRSAPVGSRDSRWLYLTDEGRKVAARLAAERVAAAERASRQVGRVMGP